MALTGRRSRASRVASNMRTALACCTVLLGVLPSAGAFLTPSRAFAARSAAATRFSGRDGSEADFAWTRVETDFCLVPQGKELHPLFQLFLKAS